MFENLTHRLSGIVKNLRGQARLTEDNIQDALREVRLALLEADVALPVVKEFVARVREKALGQDVVGSLTPGQALVGVVHQELSQIMAPCRRMKWRLYQVRTVLPTVALSSLRGRGLPWQASALCF